MAAAAEDDEGGLPVAPPPPPPPPPPNVAAASSSSSATNTTTTTTTTPPNEAIQPDEEEEALDALLLTGVAVHEEAGATVSGAAAGGGTQSTPPPEGGPSTSPLPLQASALPDDDELDALERQRDGLLGPQENGDRGRHAQPGPVHVPPSELPPPRTPTTHAMAQVATYFARATTGLTNSLRRAVAWPPRPPGPREAADPAARAFRVKLGNAWRPALACFLATGVSMVYPWSNKVTWFSITLSISGVGRNLGHTLESFRQQWLGAALAVPLCLLLGLCAFSKALTGLLVFLVTVAIVATDALTEPAKKLCIIFVVWDVLIPTVQPQITLVSLMVDLLTAVLGATIVCIAVMTLPVPHPALWLCRWRLEELCGVMGKFVEDAVASFCLEDDSELYDLEGVIDEASSLLQQCRALLPDVRFELSLVCGRHRHRTVAYDRLARYLTCLEAQVENCRGMAVALTDLVPNATHAEFVKAMQPGLLLLARECRAVLQGTCDHICGGLRFGGGGRDLCWWRYPSPPARSPGEEEAPLELFMPPKTALAQVLTECLRSRMRVVYGVELVAKDPVIATTTSSSKANGSNGHAPPDMPPALSHNWQSEPSSSASSSYSFAAPRPLHARSSASVAFARSAEAARAARAFQEESARIGYMNLLPRNAFVLDLELFVEGFEWHHAICNSSRRDVPVRWARRAAAWWAGCGWSFSCKGWWKGLQGRGLKFYRQPLKVGLAVLLASLVVLADDDHLGLQTIWAPITVAQTMSSHPSSAFKSGINRVMGTVLGAIFGLAITQWYPVHNHAAVVVLLSLWVFICGWNRGSATYGEVAVSAALTAPIVVVGPVVGSSGAVVRISQVILGTVIYVVTDNLIFPVRAKLLLRAQLCESVRDILHLCRQGLATFIAEPEPRSGGAGSMVEADLREQDVPEKIRAALQKESLFLALATDEPELWHKPFQRQAYAKALAIQTRMHRYLLMLYRASTNFPKELAEWDQSMLKAYESIIKRLQRTVEACLHEALARLQLLKRSSRIAAVTTPAASSNTIRRSSSNVGGGGAEGPGGLPLALPATPRVPCVNLFDVRQEFSDVQETIDRFVTEYFSRDPVLTSLSFIVPLNGMLYSVRKMGPECVSFVTAVRELVARERKVGGAGGAVFIHKAGRVIKHFD